MRKTQKYRNFKNINLIKKKLKNHTKFHKIFKTIN